MAAEELDPLPVSALNHLLFCERRCALIHVEGVFVENASTLEGRYGHETADTPGYETRAGIRVVRALPIYSRRLGLAGKADIVEFRPTPGGGEVPCPVDYKHGKKSRWENDDVQLCAQALCLEEMFSTQVPSGAVFHAASKRRREIEFTRGLRETTVKAVGRLRELVQQGRVPRAVLLPKCDGCSLKDLCLPELEHRSGAVASARRALFDADPG